MQDDVDLAVNAAKTAFQSDSEWRKMDASARGQLMYKLSELIDKHKIHLANLESLDNGKPFSDSLLDIQMAVSTLQYYAGFADKIHGKTIPAGNFFSGGELLATFRNIIYLAIQPSQLVLSNSNLFFFLVLPYHSSLHLSTSFLVFFQLSCSLVLYRVIDLVFTKYTLPSHLSLYSYFCCFNNIRFLTQ